MTILLGLALECEIAERAVFARKNYFYPDLPKGYQISQYEAPLCGPGRFVLPTDGRRARDRRSCARTSRRTRRRPSTPAARPAARWAPTTASSTSTAAARRCSRSSASPTSARPRRRCRYLRLLRQTIVELGVSDAEMEKGTLRADVNVSVRRAGEEGFRPRWEIKNMNSFRFIGRGDRGGVPAAGRGARARRDGRAVDLRLRRRHRPADRAPLEGGGGRLPLLPRARPRPGRSRRRSSSSGCAGRCPSGRRADPAALEASSASRRRTSSSSPATSGRRRRWRPRASTGRRPPPSR